MYLKRLRYSGGRGTQSNATADWNDRQECCSLWLRRRLNSAWNASRGLDRQ